MDMRKKPCCTVSVMSDIPQIITDIMHLDETRQEAYEMRGQDEKTPKKELLELMKNYKCLVLGFGKQHDDVFFSEYQDYCKIRGEE